MSETFTIPIPLEFKAPDFVLPDTVSGKMLSFSQLKGDKGTVVIFICNHCPYVIHVIHEIVNMAKEYTINGIAFVAISANDIENYPQDSPSKMKEHAIKWDFDFPYLYDETQEVAKVYKAACTPDYNVFDKEDLCVYRGQLDDARPGNNQPVNGKDLRYVLDCLIADKPILMKQKLSAGCNIKWKKGDALLRPI